MPIWGNSTQLTNELAETLIPFLFSAPPKPSKKEVPEVLGKTTTTVNIQFKKGLFSDEYGQVIDLALT